MEVKGGEKSKKIWLLKGQDASEFAKRGTAKFGERREAAISVEHASCELEHQTNGDGTLHSDIAVEVEPCCGMGGDSDGTVISDGAVANTAGENEGRCERTIGVEHATCELEHHETGDGTCVEH